ncbi:MAG TPA: hypothetical protein VMT60_01715, partial [Candidatus Bathyarchaeia archaeon]|nr:hypothetical protein [Candidatus Bathyarchaeia archaeon]
MKTTKGFAAAFLICSLAGLCLGCGARKSALEYAEDYRRIASLAGGLCAEIEPLRASRLGVTASDSLLFTYSEDEIKGALKRARSLEAQFSKIPAGRLNATDTERATVVINWLRGAVFAFDDLGTFRWNPLLYSWTAREALWVLPSRLAPPYEGELEAYRKRILRIPVLFAVGRQRLENPTELHARYAVEELDTLVAALPAIKAVVRQRYGSSLDGEIETVRSSILDFRRHIVDQLLGASHGKLILGSENLSKIFLYGELINADPNLLIGEGQKQISRLENERSSVLKRVELERKGILPARPAAAKPADESFESRVERLLKELQAPGDGTPSLGGAPGAGASLALHARPEYLSGSDKAPCLSIPPAGDRIASAVTLPFSAPVCQTRLALSVAAPRADDDALRFALLCALPRMLETARVCCEAKDTMA